MTETKASPTVTFNLPDKPVSSQATDVVESKPITILFKAESKTAKVPERKGEGAGYDLYADEGCYVYNPALVIIGCIGATYVALLWQAFICSIIPIVFLFYLGVYKYLNVSNAFRISTGVSMAIPYGKQGRIANRSGISLNGITVGAGEIDPSYRGRIDVVLHVVGFIFFYINKGDRIAQIVIEPYETVQFKQVDELPKTERGTGGFGSTGTR